MTTPGGTFLIPYLFFEGRCEEALEFYRTALGAKVQALFRFKDSPEPHQPGAIPPGSENKIMHAHFDVCDTMVMVSDGRCNGQPDFKGFALSLNPDTEGDAERYFNALTEGGRVVMPLTKTFYSPRFGMVTDKFGVLWMVMVRP